MVKACRLSPFSCPNIHHVVLATPFGQILWRIHPNTATILKNTHAVWKNTATILENTATILDEGMSRGIV